MNNLYDKLIYFPVNTFPDSKAFQLSGTILTNPVRQKAPEAFISEILDKIVMSDSGGFQYETQGLSKGKAALVGSLFENRINDPDILTIGLVDNCREYNRINSSFAFCVDIPTDPNEPNSSYYYKIKETVRARDQTLELSKHICPNTQMGIVMQPRNPLEIDEYYSMLATPEVSLYAYPVRAISKDALLGCAYVMSYLHSVRVSHVHLLGSSSYKIITLLAKAVVLGLFDKCSFDSRTWNQQSVSGYRYLCPETLKTMPIAKEKSLRPDANLQWELRRYKKFLSYINKQFDLTEFMMAKRWLGAINIGSIKYFKNRMLDKLEVQKPGRLGIHNEKRYASVVPAMNLLRESKLYGHDFVKDKYTSFLKEQMD